MSEGSVFVDGVSGPEEETTVEDTTVEESQNDTQTEESASENVNKSTSQEEEQSDITEKGTKLDINPLSRANQIAANERAKARQYEELLNDPIKLRAYMSQFEQPKEQEPEEKEEDLSWIQTDADLQKYLKDRDKRMEEKLEKKFSSLTESQKKLRQQDEFADHIREVSDSIEKETVAVKEKYPELDAKSDQYSPELDAAVSELFHASDFDSSTNTYMGRVSLLGVADRIMHATRSMKEKASKQAQTKVLDRTTSRVRTGTSAPEEVDTTKMSASQLIAHRMQLATKQRNK